MPIRRDPRISHPPVRDEDGNEILDADETPTLDLRRLSVIALCLLAVGATLVTVGVTILFGPVGIICCGAVLLGAGVVLGLMA